MQAKATEGGPVRRVIVMLAMFTAGGLSGAFADPPVSPGAQAAPVAQATQAPSTATPSSTAAASSSQTSATQPASGAAPVTPAQAPAAVPSSPTLQSSKERTPEQALLAQGYTIRMRGGKKMYCKKDIPIGSNLPQLLCVQADDPEAMARAGRELAERIQHNQFPCLRTGRGGGNCGN